MLATGTRWLNVTQPRSFPQLRLICFPQGGGGPQAYCEWARQLPDWIEVGGVALPGRGARLREPPITDMATMRRAIADELVGDLDRPFALFGHSAGALLAFEVAFELQARRAPLPLRVFLSGYASPGVAARAEPLFDKPDEELLRFLGAIRPEAPPAALDRELRNLLLQAVRADFRLAETHVVPPNAALMAPLCVLGGDRDTTVPAEHLSGWREHAGSGYTERLFPGGHFYTETARPELLSYLTETLRSDLDGLPRSLLFGDREDFPLDTCLHELFRFQAARTPDALAVADQAGELTFRELDRLSDLMAERFLAQGCGPDRLVAILMEPCTDFVIAYLAALKAGGAYLPIPVATPDAAIAEILQTARPVAIAASPQQSGRLPPHWQTTSRCTVMMEGWPETIASLDRRNLSSAPEPGPDNLAYCVMTSGTTGRPKGIVCPHRGAVNSYWWRFRHLSYEAGEREACNVFFVWEVLRPLLQGRPAFVISDDVIFDPRRLVAFLECNRITRVLLTPSLLDQVLSGDVTGLADRLRTLRIVILNGEVVTGELARRFAQALPHVTLVNDYSISECHDVATVTAGGDVRSPRPYLPVGRPMSNVSIYILDDALKPLPQGVPGEVYIGGESVARGYLEDPDETTARFLPDPFAVECNVAEQTPRMFRTGDIGRVLPDGQVEISGRAHFMVKLRGYSVVPDAVAAEIRSFARCAAAAVVAVDDARTGQPDYLAAYVVSTDRNREIDVAALRGHLKERLPHYAIPSVFVELDRLPIDRASGKVDRARLPQPTAARPDAGLASSLPRGDMVSQVAAIWQRVLRVPQIEREDNFFDLGGHSLLAAEMTRAVELELGISVDVIDVYEHPTTHAYAAHIAALTTPAQTPVARRGMVHGTRPREASADIAVIGMAGRFPGAADVDALWDLVCDGRMSIRAFDDAELRRNGVPQRLIGDPGYVKAGAIIDDVADFDPRFWGLSEAEATIMDPQQRIFLECCWHALEVAGHAPQDAQSSIGVFAGCYLPSYLIHHLGANEHLDPADPARFHLAEIGNDKDYLASRTAYLMDLKGPAIGVQTSCSTALVAIAQAAAALRDGQCAMALAGAASITFPQGGFVSTEGHIGTKSGRCRAFDAAADGTILGDGVGVVVLRRLDEALTDGDEILAVIKGYAVNNDGAAKAGYSAPSASGQAAVIARALRMAGIKADSVGYVEAHGTGTHLGDPIEVRGLTEAFRQDTDARGICALGSIKPNIGHSNIAAGVAGFIKAVLAVKHGVIPPLAGFGRENPELRLIETPFYIPSDIEAWPEQAGAPRRAGVSSFGIGGTNCHVVIEAAPLLSEPASPEVSRPEDRKAQVLPVSAKSPEALAELAARLAGHIRDHPEIPLADIAATLQCGRTTFPHRLAVAALTHEEAANALLARAKEPYPAFPSTRNRAGEVEFSSPSDGSRPRAERLARDWEGGTDVDWASIRGQRPFRRVPLPGYPFERIICWPDSDRAQRAPAVTTTERHREARLPWHELFHLPSWGRSASPPPPVWTGTYILLSPANGPAAELAEELSGHLATAETKVVRLRTDCARPASRQADEAVVQRVARSEGQVRIVDLQFLDAAPADHSEASAMVSQLNGRLASLANRTGGEQVAYWLIVDGALKVEDESACPLLAPLAGPLIVASQEYPRLAARLIDLRRDGSRDQARRLAEEVMPAVPRPEPLLAIRRRHRWVERFEPLHLDKTYKSKGADRLASSSGPHVITGGLGRIGLSLAKRLTGYGRPVFLLSRRSLEDERAWRLAEFHERAELVRYIKCDVSDASALRTALGEVAGDCGGLGGIFHAAGVADLRYLEETTHATVAAECASKIAGTQNLRDAIDAVLRASGSGPDFVMLFSSLAAILGGLGMSGYAAANRYLDAFVAQCDETDHPPWIAVNFDDWDFPYGKEQVGAFARTRQGLAIPPEEGLDAIEAILGAPDLERVVLSATPLAERVSKWGRLPDAAETSSHGFEQRAAAPISIGTAAERPVPVGDLPRIVLKAYAKVIGSRDLAPDADFFELGGDSLLAAQLAMELRGALPPGDDVSIGDIFDFPTPRLLAGHLDRMKSASGPVNLIEATSGKR